MGKLDLNAVKKAHQTAKEEAERRKAKRWNFKEGRNKIRLLPPWEGSGVAWKAYGQHFNIGPEGKNVEYCPQECLGLPCPVCTALKPLYKGADEDMKKYLSSVNATPRFMANIIDLTKPEDGVQQADIPRTVMEMIWTIMIDEDTGIGDVTDPKTGYNLIVDRTGSGIGTKYTVQAAKEPSAIDPKFLEGIIDLDKLVVVNTYEHIQLVWEGKTTPAITAAPARAELPPPPETGAIEVEFTEAAPAGPAGPPPCFGSFSDDNAKCLDCQECDDCEAKMIETKRAARAAAKAGKPAAEGAKRTPTAEPAEVDLGADDLLAEMNKAIAA